MKVIVIKQDTSDHNQDVGMSCSFNITVPISSSKKKDNEKVEFS